MATNEPILIGEVMDAEHIRWLISEIKKLPVGTLIHAKPPVTYTVELTQKEAELLVTLGGYIGGDPKTSARYHYDRIVEKLENKNVLGYDCSENDFLDGLNANANRIWLAAPR